uniref:50S ribosomal protein L20 n=1 Tax=Phaeostrophion irregulare TaxID=243268 RepID=UPI002E75D232|nr:50S ribosomal protein L20 [Phaeostrophion irregulare]WAM64323.1 50S ribosomal protein L20 [Phaeostrophion irregulare]
MVRVKRGNVARNRRNKILKTAKGFYGTHSSSFRIANQQVIKSLLYGYRGRKNKKRIYRQLWITRINAAVRKYEYYDTYSRFIHRMKKSRVILNRKMLSQLSIVDERFFKFITLSSQNSLIFNSVF